MLALAQCLPDFAAQTYKNTLVQLDIDPRTDLSRQGYCGQLSKRLVELLVANDLPAHRELHISDAFGGRWHMLIGHGAVPGVEELVTDLCPWQFTPHVRQSGFFHGQRQELEKRLLKNGALINMASLVSTATITVRDFEGMPHF